MRPPCEIIIQYVLPAFRALVAKNLIERYNFTQTAAAKKLGTTQAAVSHYLHSKRGEKQINQLEADPEVMAAVDEVTKGIVNETFSSIDTMIAFCKLCMTLKSEKFVCKMHKDHGSLPNDCDACLF